MQNSSQAFSSSRKSWVAVWPDLAKICHFGKKLKYAWLFLDGLLSTWQNFDPTLAIFYVIWQTCIVVNGQILSNKSSHLVTLLGRYNRHSTISTCNASKQAWTDSIKIRAEFKILIWRVNRCRSLRDFSRQNEDCSVTRWPDCAFNIWPFTKMKIWPKTYKLCQSGFKDFAQNKIDLKYIAKDFYIFA